MISSILIGLIFLKVAGSDLNPPELQKLVQTGLNFAYIDEYDSARVYFDKVIENFPDNPAGYFFKAALLQLKMMDDCRYTEEKEYLTLIEKSIRCSEDILKQEDNLWAQFYLGSSYTYRAVYEGMKKNYFGTFKYGVKGGSILQKIISKDSTFYDAYLGAGTYEYFWARASRYLPVLKLVGGNAEQAIRKIHLAAEHSFYSGPTAKNSLVFIYGEEKKFEKADSIIDELLTLFPEGRTFLWYKAELEYKKKEYLKAIALYDHLFSVYNGRNPKNYANLAQCKFYIGKCYYELKDKEHAREALKEVISYKKHSDEYPQIKQYCRQAYGLLSRIF